MLLGSGTELVVVVDDVPRTVKASEGIEPTLFSEACDGQPGPEQPTPLFSSQ